MIAGAIMSLCDNMGVCEATNSMIADLAGVSESTVKHAVVPVCKFCTMKIAVSEAGENPKTCRIIRVPQSVVGQCAEIARTYSFIMNMSIKNKDLKTTITETTKDRNARWKREVLYHLNSVLGLTGKHMLTSPTSLSLRFNEGATLEDCLLIIDYKYAEWGNDDGMRQYIRPKTLFSKTHFPEYLRMANIWDEGGRQSVGRNNKKVKDEIRAELLGKKDRLHRDWLLLSEEYDIIEINPDKSPAQMERMLAIKVEQEEIEVKGKYVTKRIRNL